MARNNSDHEDGKQRSKRPREALGKERVMQVARQLFLAHGFAGTSVKAVADELGISPPALYWYFPSKEDLYVSVIEQAMEEFLSFVRGALTDNSPEVRLGQLVRAHVTWQLQQAGIAQAFDLTMNLKGIISDIPEDRLESILKMEQDYALEVRNLLILGNREGIFDVDDPKTTSFAILTLCEYATSWYKPDGELSVAAVANKYDQIVQRIVATSVPRAAPRGAPGGTSGDRAEPMVY